MGEFIEVGNDKAVKLEEYQGTFSVSLHRKYNDKFYWVGVRTVKGGKGKEEVSEKTSPMKVTLGDRYVAIATLQMLLKELGAGEEIPF